VLRKNREKGKAVDLKGKRGRRFQRVKRKWKICYLKGSRPRVGGQRGGGHQEASHFLLRPEWKPKDPEKREEKPAQEERTRWVVGAPRSKRKGKILNQQRNEKDHPNN